MLSKVLEILLNLINIFVHKDSNKKIQEINREKEKQQEIDFKSHIEDVVAKAKSTENSEKQKAIDEMRKLISE